MRQYFIDGLKTLQDEARQWLATDCGSHMVLENWKSQLGLGVTGAISGGLIEKAGVNISMVSGRTLPASATQLRPELKDRPFGAQGLSIILHPHSPHTPTAHFNIRRFEVTTSQGVVVWFGGGFDITPYFLDATKARAFHQNLWDFLKVYDSRLYHQWSLQCDDYFYLKHRAEPRGIGGIFFDDFLYNNSESQTIDFLMAQAHFFYKTYRDFVGSTQQHYTQREKDFQYWRRGRYVEFNLLYDRGTRFGLESGGRCESILISMPPQVTWIYQGEEFFTEESLAWKTLIQSTQHFKNMLRQKAATKEENLLVF